MKLKISTDEPLPKGKIRKIHKKSLDVFISHTESAIHKIKPHKQRRRLIRRKIHNAVIPLHMPA